MERIGLFPGSFDPFTKGHEAVIKKAKTLFDLIIIGVGINTSKQSYFPTEKRLKHIRSLYEGDEQIQVEIYQKLTVDFALEVGAQCIIRGLRDSKDFTYEKPIAHMNFDLSAQKIETVFFLTEQKYAAINSNIVREIHRNHASIAAFVSHENLLD